MLNKKYLMILASFCLVIQAHAKNESVSNSRAEAKECHPKFELDIDVKDQEEIEYTLKDKDKFDGKEVKKKKIRIADPDGSEFLLAMNLLSKKLTDSELKAYRRKAIVNLEKFIQHWEKLGQTNKDVAEALQRAEELLAQIRDGKFNQSVLNEIAKEVIKPVDVAVAEMKREGKEEEMAEFEGSQKPIFKPIPKPEDVAQEDKKPMDAFQLYQGVTNIALNHQITKCIPFDVNEEAETENSNDETKANEARAVTQNDTSAESSAGIE